MIQKMISIVRRDVGIARKDPLALWVFLSPILLAVVVRLVTPGITDTTVNLAIQSNVPQDYITTVGDFASVHVYDSLDEITERVLARDEVIGVVNGEDGTLALIAQGDESESSLALAQLLNALYTLDTLDINTLESRLGFVSFGEQTPALTRSLSLSVLLLCTIISAMMIALGLVDEKNDQTIKAANVTPLPQSMYMLSKSIIGVLMLFVVSVISLLVLGLTDINFAQMGLLLLSIGLISILIAFVIGLASSDFIEAAGSIKGLMVPAMAGILVPELLAEKWHFTVWWNPFYWAYIGMTDIFNKTATWGEVGRYTAIIISICMVSFALCAPHIRKHLN
ncbi:MAG: ABC transporter permease [Faecalibacterium sp.]